MLLQKFLKSAYNYCVDIEVENTCMDTALARSVENLLQRNLRQVLEKSINDPDKTLHDTLQFITNLHHMDKSIKDIESYIKVDNIFWLLYAFHI